MTVLSLDQFALRRELRGLDGFDRRWFQLMAAATATALSEGRASTITTNAPEILDCCRHLAVAGCGVSGRSLISFEPSMLPQLVRMIANPMIVASRQRSETSERPHHRLCALHRPATWPRRDDRSVDRCGEAGKLDRGESRIDGEDLTDCWNS
jgi:hypothetical protein